MQTIGSRPRSLLLLGMAALLGACASAPSSAPAPTLDAGTTWAGAAPATANAPLDTTTAASVTSVNSVMSVDWRARAAAIDPVLAARLPTVDAIGPIWSMVEVEALVSEPASGIQPTDCDADAPSPAGLTARFDIPVAATPSEYREGTLEVVLRAGDPAIVDAYVAGQIATSECLSSMPRERATMTPITAGLPEGTFAAYRLEFEPDEQQLLGEPITVLTDATFLWMRRGDAVATVVVSLIQMADHPELADSTTEAIRIAASISPT